MKDERIQAVVHQSQAMGFSILYFGMLAIFLFRMVYLKQSVRDFGDFALVWLIAGLSPSLLTAMRGGLDTSQKPGRARWLAPMFSRAGHHRFSGVLQPDGGRGLQPGHRLDLVAPDVGRFLRHRFDVAHAQPTASGVSPAPVGEA